MFHVLVAEDNPNARKLMEAVLRRDGYVVFSAADGVEALRIMDGQHIDLVVLDIMMPRMDGLRATIKIREEANIPVIMLSAKGEDTDKIMGLNLGADDYITKPFSPTELNARVDSLYRRIEVHANAGKGVSEEIRHGEFVLNMRRHTLSKNDRNIELTQVEFQIIEYLFTNPDTPLERNDILTRVWGESYFGEEKIVDVNIRRLRMKIEDEPSNPKHLLTVWGMGYKWCTG